jgi:uncharacterized protein (DUF1697 family)
MSLRIAFFRGINVGGRNLLPMADLRAILESLGSSDVATYIQSGNVVFSHKARNDPALSRRICAAIEAQFGFLPGLMLLSASELQRAAAANPFPDAIANPKTLHLWFLAAEPAQPDLDGLEALAADSEAFSLGDGVFYLHAPDGIGRSRLAQRVERLLGVPATARNWRTIDKMLSLSK